MQGRTETQRGEEIYSEECFPLAEELGLESKSPSSQVITPGNSSLKKKKRYGKLEEKYRNFRELGFICILCILMGSMHFGNIRHFKGLPRWLSGKESACQAGCGFSLGQEDESGRRKWQLIAVFLPGESHVQEDPGRLQSIGLQRVGHD